MTKQLHQRFTTDQMKALLKKYEAKEIESSYILNILNISRRRFSLNRDTLGSIK
jgi:hypothetical protein